MKREVSNSHDWAYNNDRSLHYAEVPDVIFRTRML
jgi:hypothetical protein